MSATFEDVFLLEYLRKDSRPTFVLSSTQGLDASDSQPNLSFSNKAFEDLNLPWAQPGQSAYVFAEPEIGAFVKWINQQSSDPYFYHGMLWSAVTVQGKWCIISASCCAGNCSAVSTKVNGNLTSSHRITTHHAGENNNDIFMSSLSRSQTKSAQPLFDTFGAVGHFSTALSQHYNRVQSFAWTDTPLGPVGSWSDTLFQVVSFTLSNPEPTCVVWGKERILIYNEPYISLIENYHPAALGTSAKITFESIWPPFEKIVTDIEQTGRQARHEEICVPLDRTEGLEEAFFSYIFAPIFGADEIVNGVLIRTTEVTKQVVAQRHLNTLIKIGENTSSLTTLNDFWNGLSKALQQCPADLPFLALYSLENDLLVNDSVGDRSSGLSISERWHLKCSTGFPHGHPAIPDTLDGMTNSGFAPAMRAAAAASESGQFLFGKGDKMCHESLFQNCTERGMSNSYSRALVCPLEVSAGRVAAWIILGINPLRPYDEEYKQFVNLLCRHIEDTATSVILLQKETLHMQRTMDLAEHQRQWLSEQLREQIKEAQDSELRFYNFAKQAPVGVYILGPDGAVKFANDAWCNMTGVPQGFDGHVPWRVHVHPEDLEAADHQWQELVEGKVQKNFEWRVIDKSHTNTNDEGVKYLRSSAFPELNSDGSMKTVTGILLDISVHKAHERAVADRLTAALEAKRAQENFMDMVSHEMRNPLNAMLQCAEEAAQLLEFLTASGISNEKEGDLVGSILEAVGTIQYCGRHQKQIIDDVLTISKLDSNLLTLSPTKVVPVSIIDQALKIFASEIRAADIEVFRLTDSPKKGMSYLIDPSRVLQIMINLVGNAIKFLKGRPIRKLQLSSDVFTERVHSTRVKYVPSGQQRGQSTTSVDWGTGRPVYLYFSVTDTGPGLTPEEIDHLFARFRQASPRTHVQYGGSGLGLFISRELAELHGGEIGLSSEVDQGTTFAFYVKGYTVPSDIRVSDYSFDTNKVDVQPRQETNGSTSIPSISFQSSSDSVTILVVEDNLVNQKVLDRQLKRLGFGTITANHGQEALERLGKSNWWRQKNGDHEKISIVLCDLEMPVMDGLTCVRHIRGWERDGSLNGHIPMVAVTGNARPEQVNLAKAAGFDEVVSKPYSVQDLVPLIHRLLHSELS